MRNVFLLNNYQLEHLHFPTSRRRSDVAYSLSSIIAGNTKALHFDSPQINIFIKMVMRVRPNRKLKKLFYVQ